MSILLPTKPSQFPTTTPILPIRRVKLCKTEMVAADVALPETISTSFIICAGEKKCQPANNSRRCGETAEAISSTSNVEVLLRMMQLGEVISSIDEKIFFLTFISSTTASTTSEHGARSSSFCVGFKDFNI